MTQQNSIGLFFIVAIILTIGSVASCATANDTYGKPFPVEIDQIFPDVVIPGTRLLFKGENLDSDVRHHVFISGKVVQNKKSWSVSFSGELDSNAELLIDDRLYAKLKEGEFYGSGYILSKNDGGETHGKVFDVSFTVAQQLDPRLDSVQGGAVYLNSTILVKGDGFLQGREEGETKVEIKGYDKNNQLVTVVLPLQVISENNRKEGTFDFSPKIAGINPGTFSRTISLINTHSDNQEIKNPSPQQVTFVLNKSYISPFASNTVVSIGRYWNFYGRGFLEDPTSMYFSFNGSFTPRENPSGKVNLYFKIIPTYKSGEWAQMLLPDPFFDPKFNSALNTQFDPAKFPSKPDSPLLSLHQRYLGGTLEGIWKPVLNYNGLEIAGEPVSTKLYIGGPRQAVWVRFLDGWRDALRKYGLLAADQQIRKRVLEAIAFPYQGINIYFSEAEPSSDEVPQIFVGRLDISNVSTDMTFLMGLDATHNKDRYNKYLNDWVGGFNVWSREDDFAAYGGVFVEVINWVFSEHPFIPIAKIENACKDSTGVVSEGCRCGNENFDLIFDPFRADIGNPLRNGEIENIPVLTSTTGCLEPTDRSMQAACAILVLGNMVGTTAAHEFGHTLGLSWPDDPNILNCHQPGSNVGTRANRLMVGKCGRPFEERAEVNGQGPGIFCKSEFEYLQTILPPDQPTSYPFKDPITGIMKRPD